MCTAHALLTVLCTSLWCNAGTTRSKRWTHVYSLLLNSPLLDPHMLAQSTSEESVTSQAELDVSFRTLDNSDIRFCACRVVNNIQEEMIEAEAAAAGGIGLPHCFKLLYSREIRLRRHACSVGLTFGGISKWVRERGKHNQIAVLKTNSCNCAPVLEVATNTGLRPKHRKCERLRTSGRTCNAKMLEGQR